MNSTSIELICLAVIVPCILVFFNVIVLAKYIDPEAAAGHYIAKLFLVRSKHAG